jgi:glucan phosphoethanolaminetransferase (alkaline phosphatase superfamily)
MWIAIAVVIGLFSGITIYALEVVNLSNYLSWIPLIKWSLYIGLPISVLVSWLFHRSNAWVKPMVYRMMFFFGITILAFVPLVLHLLNTKLPSPSRQSLKTEILRVNGHQMRRFGVLEDEKQQQFDYYILLLNTEAGPVKYRVKEWSESFERDDLILHLEKGFLGIPYLRLNHEN